MEVLHWLAIHWLDLLQSIGIIGGFAFTAYSLRKDDQARRIANLLTVTYHHRSIWRTLYEKPQLARILEKRVDLAAHPISLEERLFVTHLILHLEAVYQVMKEGMFVTLEGLQQDVAGFFARPIAKSVWNGTKHLRNEDFVQFIDDCSTHYQSQEEGDSRSKMQTKLMKVA